MQFFRFSLETALCLAALVLGLLSSTGHAQTFAQWQNYTIGVRVPLGLSGSDDTAAASLAAGTLTREAYVRSVVFSTNVKEAFITNVFQWVLLRNAKQNEITNYAAVNEYQMRRTVIQTAEYNNLHPDDREFVTSLYLNMLGRMPESETVVDSWINNVVTSGRESVVQAFYSSPEYQAKYEAHRFVAAYPNYSGGSPGKENAEEFIILNGASQQYFDAVKDNPPSPPAPRPSPLTITVPSLITGSGANITASGGIYYGTLSLFFSEVPPGTNTTSFTNTGDGATTRITPGGRLPDGTYRVFASALCFNRIGKSWTTSPVHVIVDAGTITPTLTQPTVGTYGRNLPLAFTLPEPALSNSTTVSFGNITWTLSTPPNSPYSPNFTVDVTNPRGTTSVLSGATLPDGTYPVTLRYRDSLGNVAAASTTRNITIDTTPPALLSPSLNSTNANPTFAKVGDTVRLGFAFNEPTNTPVVTLFGQNATVSAGSNNTWLATATVNSSTPEGAPTFRIVTSDSLGNSANITTANFTTSVVIDRTPPAFPAVSIAASSPDWARAGDTLQLHFTTNEATTAPTVAILGQSANVTSLGDRTWSASATVNAMSPQGAPSFLVTAVDLAGNSASTKSPTLATPLQIDSQAPTGGTANVTPANLLPGQTANVTFANWSDLGSLTYAVDLADSPSPPMSPLPSESIPVVAPDSHGQYTLLARISDAAGNVAEVPLTLNVRTRAELWRLARFGTADNIGNAADDSDPDKDGLVNFLEWGLNSNPTQSSHGPSISGLGSGGIEFTYDRSFSALNSGVQFIVEWSDQLHPPDWRRTGVSEEIIAEADDYQRVKALIPPGSGRSRFVRLNVTR